MPSKLVADPSVVADVGPQMSGEGKAMSPILSQADLATITPSSTNPDITDPKFAGQYRPGGKAIYFRTVTTDAFQGPNMANYYARHAEGEIGLHPRRLRRLWRRHRRRLPGAGREDRHQGARPRPAQPEGGRLHDDPDQDQRLNPDALYYGGVAQAGVKVAKQSYDILPKIIKGGGDGMLTARRFLKGVGFPAVEGWYATIAAPDIAR